MSDLNCVVNILNCVLMNVTESGFKSRWNGCKLSKIIEPSYWSPVYHKCFVFFPFTCCTPPNNLIYRMNRGQQACNTISTIRYEKESLHTYGIALIISTFLCNSS